MVCRPIYYAPLWGKSRLDTPSGRPIYYAPLWGESRLDTPCHLIPRMTDITRMGTFHPKVDPIHSRE
jgi:hypothetical protein